MARSGTNTPQNFFSKLFSTPSQSNKQSPGLALAQMGMKMMAPPPNPFAPRPQSAQGLNPRVAQQAQSVASLYGVDYNTALKLMQVMSQTGQTPTPMQYGGSYQAGQPLLVGENGPEMMQPSATASSSNLISALAVAPASCRCRSFCTGTKIGFKSIPRSGRRSYRLSN
jgi:hypothetical protein